MNETAQPNGFEPRIVAFVCKWCTYAGADLAGTSRMTYAPNVRTLMLPCTGRIDVSFVMRAFLDGADGVIVSGCHPGDCHYTAGNYRARRRWMLFRDLLDVTGFDLNRFELAWISAAEGAKWVKTIQAFTDKIAALGPHDAMRQLADGAEDVGSPVQISSQETGRQIGDGSPPSPRPSPPGEGETLPASWQNRTSGGFMGSMRNLRVEEPAQPANPQLAAAVREAFASDEVKAVAGWIRNETLARPRPSWILSADEVCGMVAPGPSGNLARLLKNPKLKALLPLGLVARRSEVLSLNVLAQEAQIDPAKIVVFAMADDGTFLGTMYLGAASTALLRELPADRPVGFPETTLKALDELMAKPPAERWAFWREQSAKCIKCYACRGSCPMCGCAQCFTDKNQPQWFPTAADGRGNFSWHLVRAFHLAGRCIGCGSCTSACPAGIPLDLLNAAMARSALKHFQHRAGLDAAGVPLQSDYLPNDSEDFIL